jgi:hypothetical protein
MLIVDFSGFKDVLQLTNINFYKLLVISYFVFCIIPRYIFPQNHIKDSWDRFILNTIYMLASVLAIVPFLVFIHIYSIVTLIMAFFFLKAALLYIFEKKICLK